MLGDNDLLDIGASLAKLHRSGDLIFWTADAWQDTHMVHCTRLNDEEVRIKIRSIGYATLGIDGTIRTS